jgi:hypothetical protein
VGVGLGPFGLEALLGCLRGRLRVSQTLLGLRQGCTGLLLPGLRLLVGRLQVLGRLTGLHRGPVGLSGQLEVGPG